MAISRTKAAVLLGIGTAAATLFAFAPIGSRGWYFCRVCGREERQIEILGVTVAHVSGGSTRYSRWFDEHIHEPHAHDWSPRGYFFGAFGLSPICIVATVTGWNEDEDDRFCKPLGFSDLFSGPEVIYLNGLPQFPDQSEAERLARWIVHTSPEGRTRLGQAVDTRSEGPCGFQNRALWGPLMEDKASIPALPVFRAAFQNWTACHPEWR